MKYYAGIGPSQTPSDVQHSMTSIAKQLSPTGWCLRSGHAYGADQAFEKGAAHKQIFLPWNGYNDGYANNINTAFIEPCARQYEIAAQHHPVWSRLSKGVQKLMARNVPIILGETLHDPVSCVITWFSEGYSGRTTHALRIASMYGVPIFNIRDLEDQSAMCKFILNAENRANQQKEAA